MISGNNRSELYKSLVHFLTLSGCSIENTGLMYGKMGIVISLFEASSFGEDENIGDTAYVMLREVLALPAADGSFDNGNIGIACALLYLIKQQYIDADYCDIYKQEHSLIVDYLKYTEIEQSNIIPCIDSLFFLLLAESFVSLDDFNQIGFKLSESIITFYRKIKQYDYISFYSNSAKILALYDMQKKSHALVKEPLIKVIVCDCFKYYKNGVVCDHLPFMVELLNLGIKSKREDITSFADSLLEIFFSNLFIEVLDYKSAIDTLYYIERISKLMGKAKYKSIEYELKILLYENDLFLHKINWRTLAGLKGGIPRLLLNKSLNKSSFFIHMIMLQ